MDRYQKDIEEIDENIAKTNAMIVVSKMIQEVVKTHEDPELLTQRWLYVCDQIRSEL